MSRRQKVESIEEEQKVDSTKARINKSSNEQKVKCISSRIDNRLNGQKPDGLFQFTT